MMMELDTETQKREDLRGWSSQVRECLSPLGRERKRSRERERERERKTERERERERAATDDILRQEEGLDSIAPSCSPLDAHCPKLLAGEKDRGVEG